jgi:hypothetical protein
MQFSFIRTIIQRKKAFANVFLADFVLVLGFVINIWGFRYGISLIVRREGNLEVKREKGKNR